MSIMESESLRSSNEILVFTMDELELDIQRLNCHNINICKDFMSRTCQLGRDILCC